MLLPEMTGCLLMFDTQPPVCSFWCCVILKNTRYTVKRSASVYTSHFPRTNGTITGSEDHCQHCGLRERLLLLSVICGRPLSVPDKALCEEPRGGFGGKHSSEGVRNPLRWEEGGTVPWMTSHLSFAGVLSRLARYLGHDAAVCVCLVFLMCHCLVKTAVRFEETDTHSDTSYLFQTSNSVLTFLYYLHKSLQQSLDVF